MGGGAPVIDAPLVAPGQCAAVDFLETVHPHIKPGVRLTLSTATPKLGSTLTATIAGAGERPVRLLLVDAEGKLSLLGAASQGSAADGSATVAARVDRSAAAGAAPHIVVALVGDFPIAVPEGAAASYFPGLADTLLGSSQEFGLDFAHFRPSAPDEAASVRAATLHRRNDPAEPSEPAAARSRADRLLPAVEAPLRRAGMR